MVKQQKILIAEKANDCNYNSKMTNLFMNLKNTFITDGYDVYDINEEYNYEKMEECYKDKNRNDVLLAFYIKKSTNMKNMIGIMQNLYNCSYIVYISGLSFKNTEYNNVFSDIIIPIELILDKIFCIRALCLFDKNDNLLKLTQHIFGNEENIDPKLFVKITDNEYDMLYFNNLLKSYKIDIKENDDNIVYI